VNNMPDLLEEITVTATRRQTGDLQYPSDLDTNSPGKIVFKVIDEDGNPAGDKISMPLPPALGFSDGASYENADLGFIGAEFADGNLTSATKKTLEDASNEQGGLQQLGKSLLVKVTGNRTKARAGATPNPNTRALFKQPNLRTYQFNFKMIPVDKDEAEKIAKIVKSFRKELYPTSVNGGTPDPFGGVDPGLQIAYNMPNRFKIEAYLGRDAKYLIEPKFGPSFLTAVTTTYNSSSGAVFSDGGESVYFSEVDLALTFLEGKALYKGNVEAGY